jgi:hypothetical protein
MVGLALHRIRCGSQGKGYLQYLTMAELVGKVEKSRLIGLLVGLILVLASSAAASRGSAATAAAGTCPSKGLRGGDVIAATQASLSRIPLAYNAQQPGNEWARHPEIIGVLSLNPAQPSPPGVLRLRYLATGRCPVTLLNESWAVIFTFPLVKVAGEPTQVAYLVDSKDGWKMWFKTGLRG